MDLATTYLGFPLPHPFMPGASPLVDDLDTVRRLEDAGAAAIVMHSLFEEQIRLEEHAVHAAYELPAESFAEATSYLPERADYAVGPEAYLELLQRIKAAHETLPVVMISGHATVSTAVEATKLGAFDFIEKPLASERVLVTIRNALDRSRLADENQSLRSDCEPQVLTT